MQKKEDTDTKLDHNSWTTYFHYLKNYDQIYGKMEEVGAVT